MIPLIGAFVGLGLLVYGLIRYKDKWLSIIGVVGILFTVLVYGSLFYAMKNASIFNKGFADISQMKLNDLVKNMEFFKLQHGKYPDSLQQLLDVDKLAPITDAIQLNQGRQNSNYYYYRTGDKYLLLSLGQDGITNTQDDLYPQIAVSDSTKIGLIKPR